MRPTIKLAGVVLASGAIALAVVVQLGIVAGDGSRASFPEYRLSFTHPKTWKVYEYTIPPGSFSSVIAYLSTQPIPDPCARLRDWISCSEPAIGSLRPDGVFVRRSANGMPGWRIAGVKGHAQVIHGHLVKVSVGKPDETCPGNTREMISAVLTHSPSDNGYIGVQACLSGPRLRAAEAEVRSMLDSVQM